MPRGDAYRAALRPGPSLASRLPRLWTVAGSDCGSWWLLGGELPGDPDVMVSVEQAVVSGRGDVGESVAWLIGELLSTVAGGRTEGAASTRLSAPSCRRGCGCCCERAPMDEPVDTSGATAWPLLASWRALVLRLWRATMRPDWHRHAACRGRDPQWWDGGRYGERARAVCQQCPVSTECLADVLTWETRSGTRADSAYGVAGGMTAPERRELYRALPESVGVASYGRRQR